MESNIKFISNVYPVTFPIYEDKIFFSKIFDYNLLKKFNSNYSDLWSSFQKDILSHPPTCSICKPDPCWGLSEKNGIKSWICKCIKTDCPHFSSCRSSFDEKELLFFSSNNANIGDEYDYLNSSDSTTYFPVLYNGEDCLYTSNEPIRSIPKENIQTEENIEIIKILSEQAQNESKQTPFLTTDKDIPSPCITDCNEKEELSTVSKIVSPPKSCIADLYDHSNNILIKTDPASNSVSTSIENIFDSFEEAEQEQIISAPANANMFIDAGPGTGKTFTLIQKLNYMVSEEQVDPDSILVLCFTNSAVDEIRQRLRLLINNGADRGLANIDIRTFHSFAWWLICQANELYSLDGWSYVPTENLNYDSCISTATTIMKRFGTDVVDNWNHFIVDEVQDLTNIRGLFVLNIVQCCLKNHRCGITVLGDSCQAIYDYANKIPVNNLSSKAFYNKMFALLKGNSNFYKLSKNHRQGQNLINIHENLRSAILSSNKRQLKNAAQLIMDTVAPINPDGNFISYDLLEDYIEDGENCCLLFRNNGEALCISSDLRKKGISHYLNSSDVDRNFSPWIADIFRSFGKPTIKKSEFIESFNNLDFDVSYSGEDVWNKVQDSLHCDNDIFSVSDILDNICNSKIDDSIFRTSPPSNLIVSTIHRAKGREYNTVIFDESFGKQLIKPKNFSLEEYKVFYVALTRPKNDLYYLKSKNHHNPRKIEDSHHMHSSRWIENREKHTSYMEFKSSIDLSTSFFLNIDQNIINTIQSEDSFTLLRTKPINSQKLASYELFHDQSETSLGIIPDTYIDDLQFCCKAKSYIDMPASIDNLYVSGIYSQIVTQDYLESHPEIASISPNGTWKWINIIGMGHMHYDSY